MWWKDYGLRLRALLFRRRMDVRSSRKFIPYSNSHSPVPLKSAPIPDPESLVSALFYEVHKAFGAPKNIDGVRTHS